MEYLTVLKQKLVKNGFTEEQYSLIHASLSETQTELTTTTQQQQKQIDDRNTERIFGLLEKVIENPTSVISIFKTNWLKHISSLIVALAILGTLVALSWKGILGTCEASTIFGGIVGYLLGKGA